MYFKTKPHLIESLWPLTKRRGRRRRKQKGIIIIKLKNDLKKQKSEIYLNEKEVPIRF